MFPIVQSHKAEHILGKTVTVQTKTPYCDIYLLSGFIWATSLLLLLVCTVFVLLFLNVIYMPLLLSLQAAVNRTVN